MSLDLTRGEIILVAFIFALVYLSGLLPKIAARLGGGPDAEAATATPTTPPSDTDDAKTNESSARAVED